MLWMRRALVLALTSLVWLPALAPASATTAPACDRTASFIAVADGYAPLGSGAEMISLTETSGLVAFVLTEPEWVIVAAEVVFASIEADGSRIGGQQIVAAPGPQGILMSGESLEFCLRAAPPPPNEVAAESANTDRDPRRAPARIIAL